MEKEINMNADRDPYREKNTFLLEITSYQNSNPTGYLIALPAEKAIRFTSLIDVIRQAQAILNRRESFLQPPHADPVFLKKDSFALATFLITVYFEQHASWQGTVCCVERQGKYTFRSALELILMIDKTMAIQTSNRTLRNGDHDSGGEQPANSGKRGINCFG